MWNFNLKNYLYDFPSNIFRPQEIETTKKRNHGQKGWLCLGSPYILHLANKDDIATLNCAFLQKSG